MTEIPAWFTRVYLPGLQKVAHLLSGQYSPSDGYAAVCGIAPTVSVPWHGTGTVREREKIMTLPVCKNCLKGI